jgi:hypothetical protein
MEFMIGKRGDLAVMVAIADDGAYAVDAPHFDTDGAGDDCFIV